MRQAPFDQVLLERALSGIAAADVVTWIRRMVGERTAVIVIEAADTIAGRPDLRGADALDANARMKRPVQAGELTARVSALARHARRTEVCANDIVEGPYRISIPEHRVWLDGRAIALSPKEFGLAVLLFRRIGESVTRRAIADAVWKRNVPDTSRTIDTHLSRVRTKLDLWPHRGMPHRGMRLAAIHAAGYRLDVLSENAMNGVLARRPRRRAPSAPRGISPP